ncbi:uncharacterized protein LOC114183499 isoform X2 [Vigna unguiculata]|uniref:uncharacterized protein LOC114183499 isoform X2 n=1 Tax=Vigna unguiculata TaxID=3917 RepID=UPI0010164856|nr:uncharacterized protein LOC114183499 isoform X2 [Vigna unguiculata]
MEPTDPEVSHESLVTDAEWVCKSPNSGISATSSGWPPFDDSKSSSLAYSLSAEEQATVAVLQLQHKALEACQKFFAGDAGSDGDEDESNDEDEEEWVDNFDPKECEEYRFFERVFAEDGDLRRYYENNHREGDFYCLVCGGIGKKVWKRFKDCASLIHHSTAILRTTRKRAHRAYAQVISKVVGCNIDQLPAIELKGLDSSLEGSRKLLGFEKEGDNLDGKVSEPSSENGREIVKESHESVVADAGWVTGNANSDFSSTASGWPSFNDTKSSSLTHSPSAEEKATMAVLQLQHKALASCRKFLVGDASSDSDEDGKDDINSDSEDDEDEDEEEEDGLVDSYDSKECKEYKFFEKVFAEDDDLRKYYENNHRDGDFYCLVCGGIRKKVWKRFKDSIALIQHSTSILRTKRKRAHRAYAQIICKVVGWDIDQLPAIVLKDLDSSKAGSKKLLVEPTKPAEGCIDDSNAEPET